LANTTLTGLREICRRISYVVNIEWKSTWCRIFF